MAYTNSKNLVDDPTFQVRVKFAVLKAAVDVAGGASSGDLDVDTKREALAFAVLQGGPVNGQVKSKQEIYRNFLEALAARETTNTDATIDTDVSAVWDDMAGVTLADTNP